MATIRNATTRVITYYVSMTALATIAVVLRLAARSRTKLKLGADDYCVIASVFVNWAYMGVNIWGALSSHVAGMDLSVLPLPQLVIYLKDVYAVTILYIINITIVKCSVLLFYRRIFETPTFRRYTTVLLFLSVCWMTTCLFAAAFRCHPVKVAWNPVLPGKCLNFTTIFMATESLNCVMEVIIVCLPVDMIRKLQLPMRRKILVSGIFFVGGFVVLISIIRMVVTAQNSVQTSGTWVVAQINVAIVCACLPTYRPILPAPRVITNSLRTLILSVKGSLTLSSTTGHQSKNTGQNSHLPESTNSRSRYRNLHDEDVVDKTHLTKAVGGADGYGVQDYPMNTIAVRNDIEVV